MVLSYEDKIVIKNDYDEFKLNAHQIWKRHHQKKWDYSSVNRLLNRYQRTGSIDRVKGSGRPKNVATEENGELVEDLICSQEDEPHTHQAPRKIESTTGIARSSVRRIVKNRGINQFKRVKTPQMNNATRARRTSRARALAERYEKNSRMIEKTVWQDEKDFPLHVPVNSQNDRVYYRGRKAEVPDENLFKETKRLSKKIMVSAGLSWYGVTKPFFVNAKGLKVNGKRYHNHLKKELFPAIDALVQRDDWIFAQDGAPSHRSNLVQGFLKDTLKRRYIAADEWPPSSPDTNPLDYYFWDSVKRSVYEDRAGRPFKNEQELRRKIKRVWPECAAKKAEIRKAIKQFVPRLRAIDRKNGYSIKMLFK